MQFRLLGNLEVIDDGGAALDIGGTQPRTVLAMLLVAPGRVVPAASIIDALWAESPPSSAAGTLQSYVSRLRRILGRAARRPGSEVLAWDAPGYRLDVPRDSVDIHRFQALADEGRAQLDAGDPAAAHETLASALSLWRGEALLEFAHLDFAWATAAKLEERRLTATEDRIQADLQLGKHTTVIGELGELVAAHPLREGFRLHLALALYRAGRQAEALRVLDDTRRTLRDQLGIDPGPPLRQLEAAILDHDAALAVAPHPPPAAAAGTVPAGAEGADAGEAPVAGAPVAGAPSAATPATGAGVAADHHGGPADRPGGGGIRAPTVPALFGREDELAQLVAALDQATSATRVVLVEGEPGIGKTRLMETLGAVATERGARFLWGRSFEGEGAPAFWPWLTPLRQLVAELPDAVVPPLVADLVAGSGGATLDAVPAGADRFPLLDAVTQLLAATAAERPLVVVLDDLQWADPASLELISFVAGRLVDAPLLLACTVRELELGRNDAVVATLAALARPHGARRLRLGALAPAATAALIDHVTGRRAGPDVVATIQARAEGNPFFAAELAQLLIGGSAARPGMDGTELPSGVRDVLRRRLGLLPEPTRELLAVAAVIGRDLELDLLVRASGQTVDACVDALEPALVHRLVAVVPDRPSTFRFAHGLVREAVLDDITALRRARLHLRVADALEEAPGTGDDETEIIAEHLWSAVPIGAGARAAEALERAAEVAVRRSAFEAAENLLERAVHLRRTTGGGTGGPGAGGPDREAIEAAELVDHTRLLSIQRSMRGYASIGHSPHLARAKDLARRAGRMETLVRLLWTEWAAFDAQCDLDRSEQVAAEIGALADQVDEPLATVASLASRGLSRWHRGSVAEAASLIDEAARLASEVDLPARPLGLDLEVVLLPHPFSLYLHDVIGDRDPADIEAGFDRLVTLAPDRYAVSLASMLAGAGALTVGDAERAERAARRGMDADPERIFSFWTWGNEANLAVALLLAGRTDEGLALIGPATEGFLAAGGRAGVAIYRAAHAAGAVAAGRLDEARDLLDQARRLIAADGERFAEPLVLEAAAEVARAGGDGDGPVTDLLTRAVTLATRQGSLAVARRIEATAARLGVTLP
ncbi:MAG TPA: BTAD domain-containing putative transcriptional regulator [Acidimicrobiales bacterium]